MIEFKKGNYLDEKKMAYHEAKEFIVFLTSEIRRHEEHMEQYRLIAEDEDTSTLMRVTAQTVVIRNLDDIRHTQRTIDYLNEKFRKCGYTYTENEESKGLYWGC